MKGTCADTASTTTSEQVEEEKEDEREEEQEEEQEEEEEEEYYEAPCRRAARYIVACPQCGRRITIKCLRYSHKCGRSFCADKRAAEQKLIAERAFHARMAPTLAEKRRASYASLLRF